MHIHRATRDFKGDVKHVFFCPIWGTSDFKMCVKTLEVEFALIFHQTNKNTYDLSLNSPMNMDSIVTANLFEGPTQNISIFVSKARPHR